MMKGFRKMIHDISHIAKFMVTIINHWTVAITYIRNTIHQGLDLFTSLYGGKVQDSTKNAPAALKNIPEGRQVMQIKISTDYAIRVIVFLAASREPVSSTELSERMGIPKNYLPKIIKVLKRGKLLDASLGMHGGYTLAKRPEEISLFEIIESMEGTAKINRCLEDDKYCSRFATENCPVRKFYQILQSSIESKLKSITVTDLNGSVEDL